MCFLDQVFLLIAIENYIHAVTAIITEMCGYHLEVFVSELSKCYRACCFLHNLHHCHAIYDVRS